MTRRLEPGSKRLDTTPATTPWLRANRWHLAVVAALLALQFFLPDLLAWHYERQVRPGLLASGYVACAGFTSAAPDWKPDDCDVVRRTQASGGIEEHYFSRGGAEESRLHVSAHGQRSKETRMRKNQTALWVPLLAFLALGFAVLHKVVRTGKVTTWSLAAEPSDRVESLLWLYAMPLFAGSILFGLLGR
jgi:hypothetical protein